MRYIDKVNIIDVNIWQGCIKLDTTDNCVTCGNSCELLPENHNASTFCGPLSITGAIDATFTTSFTLL